VVIIIIIIITIDPPRTYLHNTSVLPLLVILFVFSYLVHFCAAFSLIKVINI